MESSGVKEGGLGNIYKYVDYDNFVSQRAEYNLRK